MRRADMNQAILVFQVLSYSHLVSSDDDSGDSGSHSGEYRSLRALDVINNAEKRLKTSPQSRIVKQSGVCCRRGMF